MRFRDRNREMHARRRRSARHGRTSEFLDRVNVEGLAQPAELAETAQPAKLAQGAKLAQPADKRTLIFEAVAGQLEHDNKRPFSLGQKLNDAPYRYTRDTLWAALNSISATLDEGAPRLQFPTEDDYIGEGDFSGFVNSCLTGTVSALINAIMGASRWPK